MEQKISAALCVQQAELFYTSVSPVHFLSRSGYTPGAYPECCHRNTTAISRTTGAQAPAILSGCLS